MGDAADEMFDLAMREENLRRIFNTACPCKEPDWVKDDDGLWECLECGMIIDE